MSRFRYALEAEEILCPICVNHMLSRWICNSQLRIGEKIISVDIHFGGVASSISQKYFGEYIVPISITLERRVFMNRPVWKPILFTIGSYDDIGTHYFKKTKLKIVEI